MLAQLLKNLYICTFLYLWTDKAGSGHSDCDVSEKTKTRPTYFLQYQPNPTPQKLRQRCRPLPCGGVRMGWKEEEKKKAYEHKSAPISTPYRNEGNQKLLT